MNGRSMICQPLSTEEALARREAYRFAYIRRLSSVSLGEAPARFDTEELLEARFFDPQGELRIFRENGALRAVELKESEGCAVVPHEYKIGNERFGASIKILQVLAFDEDGQAYVEAERLCEWKGGTKDGV